MKEELLKKAIQGDNSEVLDPVTKSVWDLRGISEEELIATAKEINENTLLDGITISGGDPLFNPVEMLKVLKFLKEKKRIVGFKITILFIL